MTTRGDGREGRRVTAREIARQYLNRGDPTGWFEELYSRAEGNPETIPWADMTANQNLVEWLGRERVAGENARALTVGCGLGDDAEELATRGFDTTAFDVSSTAIQWCVSRFPQTRVRYLTADLLEPPSGWHQTFDLVVESNTLQVFPELTRVQAIGRIAGFVAPRGTLLVIARGRDEDQPTGEMPWPLTKRELGMFEKHGLAEIAFEDYRDSEDPPVRRFRVTYGRG